MVQPKALQTPTRNFAFEIRAKEHLNKTHHPESLVGLDWSPAPHGQPFQYVFNFDLKPEKRPDRTEAPCPLCSPGSPKYFHGALVWFPTEEVYRCIGRTCAAHHIGKVEAAAAERERKATSRRNGDFEFLFANLGCIPPMILHFKNLISAAQHVEKLRHKLAMAHVREPLRMLLKNNDGHLVVWGSREVNRLDPITGREYVANEPIRESYGIVTGQMALGKSFDLSRKIGIETSNLQVLDQGEGEAAEEWVDAHAYDHPENMRIVCSRIRIANDLQKRAIEKITNVLEFFSEENFERLVRFGSDSRNTISISAGMRNGDFLIGQTLSERVPIRPNFGILSNLPPWPALSVPTRFVEVS